MCKRTLEEIKWEKEARKVTTELIDPHKEPEKENKEAADEEKEGGE